MAGIITPYNDGALKYDYDSHMYVLTEECVKNELNLNLSKALNPTGAYDQGKNTLTVLKQVSYILYTQMYSYSIYNDVQEWLAAKAESARHIIKEALKQQLLYFLFGGDLSEYNGVDIKKGRVMQNFEGRILAPNARNILERPLQETKRSLLYNGDYMFLKSFVSGIGDYTAGNY